MKKLLVILALGLLWSGKSEAAGATRGAKGVAVINYTIQFTTVTVGPGVVYSVIMSTALQGSDFVVLFDSGTGLGLSQSTSRSSGTLRGFCMAASSITSTQCNYDPPLQFNNGIQAATLNPAQQAIISYEKGRVVNGY